MRVGSVGTRILTSFMLAAGLVLAACAGSQEQRDPTWRPRERVPDTAEHWWWEPVERSCEDDDDCRPGERCRTMRLGTCTGCPRGEQTRICVGENGNSSQRAQSR